MIKELLKCISDMLVKVALAGTACVSLMALKYGEITIGEALIIFSILLSSASIYLKD